MEDRKILLLLWNRAERAIEAMAKKYGRRLYCTARNILGIHEEAEESVNDTYLAAWNHMPQDRPDYLGAYLSKIVRRISIDRFRADHRQKRGGMENFVEELTDCIPTASSVVEEYENGRLSEALNRFLYGMEEERRIVFIRRYFYGQPISQISMELGLREGSVKSILHRSREALRLLLEKEALL